MTEALTVERARKSVDATRQNLIVSGDALKVSLLDRIFKDDNGRYWKLQTFNANAQRFEAAVATHEYLEQEPQILEEARDLDLKTTFVAKGPLEKRTISGTLDGEQVSLTSTSNLEGETSLSWNDSVSAITPERATELWKRYYYALYRRNQRDGKEVALEKIPKGKDKREDAWKIMADPIGSALFEEAAKWSDFEPDYLVTITTRDDGGWFVWTDSAREMPTSKSHRHDSYVYTLKPKIEFGLDVDGYFFQIQAEQTGYDLPEMVVKFNGTEPNLRWDLDEDITPEYKKYLKDIAKSVVNCVAQIPEGKLAEIPALLEIVKSERAEDRRRQSLTRGSGVIESPWHYESPSRAHEIWSTDAEYWRQVGNARRNR